LDKDGEIALLGSFEGEAEFAPGIRLNGASGAVLIGRVSASGTARSAFTFGPKTSFDLHSLTLVPGAAIARGDFIGSADFHPAAGAADNITLPADVRHTFESRFEF
jgi:hypothetical protein